MKADAIYRDMIGRHAKAHGLRLVTTYEDLGWSGRKGSKRRPRFEEMLVAAEDERFDVLIVPKLSRFGRSMRDNLAAYDRLEAAGVAIVFLDLGADTSTPAGRLIRNIMTSLAEWESDLISERWKDTHAYLARSGRPSGQACFGYRYDPKSKRQEPHPREAAIVREIFSRFAAGAGLREISRDLERRGIRGQRGSTRWAPSLGYLLDNETYIGFRRWDGELIPGTWEPIIDRELWDQAQAIRNGTAAMYPWINRRGGKQTALLTGLAECGACGGPMWHVGHRYRCATNMRGKGCSTMGVAARKAEGAIAEAFLARLSEAHRARARTRKALAPGPRPDLETVDAELADLDRKMQRLVAASLESPGEGFDSVFRREAATLEARRDELQREAARRAMAAQESRRRSEQLDQLREQIADLPTVWEKASTVRRREMLALAVECIRVQQGRGGVKSFDIAWLPWLRSEEVAA
jgi:site-specific DNA recombinase